MCVCVCVCASSPVRRPAPDRFVDQVQMDSSSNKAFQIRTHKSADFMPKCHNIKVCSCSTYHNYEIMTVKRAHVLVELVITTCRL